MPVKSLKGGIGVRPLGFGLGGAETEATDPNFNQTVLLLHGDGSEGEGNTAALGDPNFKAFKDASTSAHALAVAGDAYGNDFSPYYYADGYWSNLFDGTDNIRFGGTSNESAFQFGTGEFTIEFFVQFVDATSSSQYGLFGCIAGFYFQLYAGKLEYHTNTKVIDISYTPNNNAFVHFAISRDSSNNLRLWIDGTLTHTVAGHTYNYSTIAGFQVMDIGTGFTGRRAKGYLSNFRVVKGSAVYSGTGSITVPTTPLTAISGTTLLACQSNRFLDNSTSGLATTLTGDPKVSTNTPFTQTKTANVGAGFFDGNTDNLTTTGNSDFVFGTNDFTAEAWVYPSAVSGIQVVIDLRYNNNSTADNIAALVLNGATLICFVGSNKSAGTDIPVIINQWNHLAIQRISGTLYFSVNGKVSSTTVALSDNLNGANQRATIGGNVDQTTVSMYTGYIADARVVNGTGVYGTSNFSVPTTSLTAVTNTKLLTCQYSGAVRNVGFVDDSKYNNRVIRNGDVSMGTFSPFSLEDGYWSYYGGNTGSYYFADSADLEIGTSDFTIEFWMNLDTISGGDYLTGKVPSSGAGGDTAFQIYMSGSAGVLNYWLQDTVGTTTISTPSSTISAHTWHFISCVRQSGTMRLYVDGVQKATGTRSGSVKDVAGGVGIGMTGEFADYLAGYMSNYRFVIGTCLRNDGTTFSVPTTPLTSTGSETKILTAQSNKFVDNSSTGRTPVFSGTASKILPFSPFAPSRSYSKDAVGGSAYFDGTGDDLTIMKSAPSQMLTTNWSIEMWVYITETGNIALIDHRGSNGTWGNQSTDGLNFQFYATSSTLYWQVASGTYLSGSYYPTPHSWNHFAVTNDGTQTTIFLNGTRILNGTSGNLASLAAGSAIDRFTIGRNPSGYDTEGYIGPVKIHLTEHYDAGASTITVPTAPFTADANTFLLLNFTNAGIIDHTMKNNLETENNTRVSGQQTKFGTGSIYFDGTGDVIKMPNDSQFTFGTGDFTIEMFVYATKTTEQALYDGRSANGAYPFILIENSSNKFIYYVSSAVKITANDTVPLNQWVHLAVARSGTTTKMFVNGTAQTETFSDSTNYLEAPVHIGQNQPSGGDNFEGYLDEYRVTKGVARYTSTFTAPTKAFANK